MDNKQSRRSPDCESKASCLEWRSVKSGGVTNSNSSVFEDKTSQEGGIVGE
jgi:hypothetical protein